MCSDIVRLSTAFLSKFGSPSVWRPDLNRTHPVCAALIPQLLLHGRRVTTMCNGIHNFQFPARMPIVMSVLLLALIASAVPAAAAADRIAADNPPVRFYWRKGKADSGANRYQSLLNWNAPNRRSQRPPLFPDAPLRLRPSQPPGSGRTCRNTRI